MFNLVLAFLSELGDDESGQGLIEYSLILFLIAVLAFAALQLIGTNVTSILSSVANDL